MSNKLSNCLATQLNGAVVKRVMLDYSKYCNEEIKFTSAVLSISSISRLTFTYMWSKGVIALSIHVTGVISFTLVNIWETVNAFCTFIFSSFVFETCNLDIIFSSPMLFFSLLTWWLWNKPDGDHGSSLHKHVCVMLLKKK